MPYRDPASGPHPDLDTLALHALGEDVLTIDQRRHVLACPGCDGEVRGLARTVGAVRGGAGGPAFDLDLSAPDDGSPPPPPHLWATVVDRLGLERPGQAVPRHGTAQSGDVAAQSPFTHETVGHGPDPVVGDPVAGSPAPRRHRPPGRPGSSVRPGSPPGAGASPARTAGQRRQSRGVLGLLLTAVVAAALGAGGSALWRAREDDRSAPVALSTSLSPVTGSAAVPIGSSGTADITRVGDVETLEISVDRLPKVSGYHGIWLIDEATGGMVPLGVMAGDATAATLSFTVPEGLDLSAYSLVDVSDEPLDGNPAHSGVSLLRGTLAA